VVRRMTVVVRAAEPETERAQAAAWVETVDAAGLLRVYRVQLGPERIQGDWIMGCRQLTEDGDSRPRFPDAVKSAARDHFEGEGLQVHGGDDK